MASSSAVGFDSNLQGNTGAELTLTNETVITMYVQNKTGTHNNSQMTIQYSPDGLVWIDDPHSTNGIGLMTSIVAASKVRAKLITVEGSDATADVFIVAK